MEIHFSDPTPVYQQISQLIRSGVISGEYPPGSKIPSVRDLASQLRVNPNTVQRALSELEQEGLLVSHGTLGRCVTEDTAVPKQLRARHIRETAISCAQQLCQLGLSSEEAAAAIVQYYPQEV